jgi:ElaA protein
VPFDALTTRELHDVLRLRAEVFVVEQDCAYQDIDGRDPDCLHILGQAGETLIAHARVVPPADPTSSVSIGRVVVAQAGRGTGVGRELMRVAITEATARWPGTIHVSAQAYLVEFYRSLGFEQVGPGYLEDGIPHLGMDRAPPG